MKEMLMNKMIAAAALTILCCLTPVWGKPCPPGHTPSVAVFNAANSVTGSARVCVDGDGAHATLNVRGLTPGHAYTVWFGYIDKPLTCVHPGVCDSPEDFIAPNPVGVVGRLDSAVAPKNGEVEFSGDVNGMLVSPGSQVQLVIFDHGMADAADLRNRARQLLTPQDPALGAPGLGVVGGPMGVFWGIAVVNF
jgi:hypothetical protein